MNKYSAVVKLWIASLAVIMMTACSDGQMSQPPVSGGGGEPSKGAPIINSFTVQDAKTAGAKAGKAAEIDEGGSVFLTWDVSGAKNVEIMRKSSQRKLDKVSGLKGKVTDEALKADETYTLTAEGSDGGKVQAQVTVTVRKKEVKISFVAKPQEIRAGEVSDLCWKIEGADPKTKVTVVDDGKKEIYPGNTVPDGQPSGTPTPPPAAPATVNVQKLLLAATPSAPPADGYGKKPADEPKKEEAKEVCIPVKPTKTTTYTLALDDGGKSTPQKVELKVNPAPAQIDITFKVNGSEALQLSGPGEVTLSWRITPPDVTVDIDHDVAKGDKADGEKKVSVKETTTFTLTATTKDGRTQSKYVTVTIGRMDGGKVIAQLLTPSVFSGESVKIVVTSDNPSAKLTVRDPRGNAPKFTVEGSTITITDPVSGNYTVESDGAEANPVSVEVRQLEVKDVGAVNGLGLRGLGLTITGDANSKAAQVNLTSFSASSKDSSVAYDFGKVFSEKMKTHADYMSNFAPYKVNAIAFSPKGRAFAGMTGGVLYSDNSGTSWNVLDVIPAYDTSYKFKDTEESHPGCFGSTRKGTKSFSASIWMVNVLEVCDLAYDDGVDGKDRLLMATDFGVFYIDGVEGHIKDPTNKAHALQGTLKKDNALFGKVVNRVVIAKAGDQKVVVAAASDGIYINTKRGDANAWQQIDKAGLKDPVNAIAVAGSTIYAGTNDSLLKYEGFTDGSKWVPVLVNFIPAPNVYPAKNSVEGLVVKALAVDAADPAILYVGTDKGLKISRSCGASFVDVAAPVGSVRNIATATEGARSAVVLTTDKGLFSSVGVASTPGECVKPTEKTTDKPKEQSKPTTTGPSTPTPSPKRPA